MGSITPGSTPPQLKTKGLHGYENLRNKIDPSQTVVQNGEYGNKIIIYKDKGGETLITRDVGGRGVSLSNKYTYMDVNGKNIELYDNNGNNYIDKMYVVGDNFYYHNSNDDADFDYKNYFDGRTEPIDIKSPQSFWGTVCEMGKDLLASLFKLNSN